MQLKEMSCDLTQSSIGLILRDYQGIFSGCIKLKYMSQQSSEAVPCGSSIMRQSLDQLAYPMRFETEQEIQAVNNRPSLSGISQTHKHFKIAYLNRLLQCEVTQKQGLTLETLTEQASKRLKVHYPDSCQVLLVIESGVELQSIDDIQDTATVFIMIRGCVGQNEEESKGNQVASSPKNSTNRDLEQEKQVSASDLSSGDEMEFIEKQDEQGFFGKQIEHQGFKSQLVKYKRRKGVKRSFKCPYQGCKKSFPDSGNLKTHIRIHTGQKPFLCEICGISFRTNGHLKSHLYVHSGERPFICNYPNCGKAYSRSGRLKIHIRTHTGERPFKCDECDKRFNERTNLQAHMRVHQDSRPYECKTCKRKFRTKASLRIHLTIHSDRRPFVCDLCFQTFKRKSVLKQHKKIHEGNKGKIMVQLTQKFLQDQKQGSNPIPVINPIPRRGPPSKAVLAVSISALEEAKKKGDKLAEQLLLQHQNCKEEQNRNNSNQETIKYLEGQDGPIFKTHRAIKHIIEPSPVEGEPPLTKIKVFSGNENKSDFLFPMELPSVKKNDKSGIQAKRKREKEAGKEGVKAEIKEEIKEEESQNLGVVSVHLEKEIQKDEEMQVQLQQCSITKHSGNENQIRPIVQEQEPKEEEKKEKIREIPPLQLKIPLPPNSESESSLRYPMQRNEDPHFLQQQRLSQLNRFSSENLVGLQQTTNHFQHLLALMRLQQIQRERANANLLQNLAFNYNPLYSGSGLANYGFPLQNPNFTGLQQLTNMIQMQQGHHLMNQSLISTMDQESTFNQLFSPNPFDQLNHLPLLPQNQGEIKIEQELDRLFANPQEQEKQEVSQPNSLFNAFHNMLEGFSQSHSEILNLLNKKD